MSEESNYEVNTASQRHWLFGSNAILMSVLALLVALILLGATYLLDTSYHFQPKIGGNALSANTRDKLAQIEKDGKSFRIISLFTSPDDDMRRNDVEMANKLQHQRKEVMDLLEQYRRSCKNITVEDKGDVSDTELIQLVEDRYKDKFKQYQDVVADFGPQVQKVLDFLDAEGARLSGAAQAGGTNKVDGEVAQELGTAFKGLKEDMAKTPDIVKYVIQHSKLPPWTQLRTQMAVGFPAQVNGEDKFYPGLASVQEAFSDLQEGLKQGAEHSASMAVEDRPSDSFKAYMLACAARLKDLTDDLNKFTDRLGKLPDLSEANQVISNLKGNPILVVGPDSVKVVTYAESYPRFDVTKGKDETFNAESSITDDLFTMAFPKNRTKVVFVEASGEAALDQSFSRIKTSLDRKNFDVSEWIPGEGAPAAEGKGSVWVIVSPDSPMEENKQLDATIRRHLDGGGSALFLVTRDSASPMDPGAPAPFASILKDYGVEVQTKYRLVHLVSVVDPDTKQQKQLSIPYFGYWPTQDDATSVLAKQQSLQAFLDTPLVLEPHDITNAVAGLPMIYGPGSRSNPQTGEPSPVGELAVVKVIQPLPSGVEATEIVKTPKGSAYWASANAMENPPKFDEKKDLASPVPLAVAAQKKVGNEEVRVVVIGCKYEAYNGFMSADMPGNEKLMQSTLAWLAKRNVLAESTGVGYIQMGPARQTTYGVIFLVVLPLIVLGCATFVLVTRRR